jgi:alpha-1,3-rhamnosyl/mannosyltransferase
MRIGIDVRALTGPRTGIGTFLAGVLDAFARHDLDYEFVLFAPKPFAFTLPNGRWRIHQMRGAWVRNGSVWLQLYGPWQVSDANVDVFWGPMFLLPILLPWRIPTLLTVHDLVSVFYPETMAPLNYWTLRAFLRASLWRAQHITADSESTADDLHAALAIPRAKVSVVYPGVAPQFHVHDPSEARQRVASQFGLTTPYLLTVSTFEPRKNLKTILSAFAALPESLRRRWPLVMVGGQGWKSAGIHATAAPLVHEGSVRILGYLGDGDLPWLYAAASLFLFPSIYEGFGLPVVEAMASGVPVAASDIPVLREIAGDSAQLVPPMEVARWSETIRALTEDASRRAALRDAGLRRAAQFTFDASAGRLLGLLERLARVGRS